MLLKSVVVFLSFEMGKFYPFSIRLDPIVIVCTFMFKQNNPD